MNQAQSQITPLLEINDICISYGSKQVAHNISIQLQPGEIGCLLGPSGCGKSTLLRAIAGFESVNQGSISISGQKISEKNVTLPPEKRNIGMVFQDISLFPHLSVQDNIRFGIKHLTNDSQNHRVKQLLNLIGLSDSATQYPHQLSGGQQQRIAIARALAPRPPLILLDEPFSGLDAKLKESLVPEIRNILKHEQVSAILVSHDQNEAFAIADKIAIMDQGKIHQWDSAYNSYHQPATKFAASFVGRSRFLPARTTCDTCIDTILGNLRSDEPHGYPANSEVDVLVRIDDVQHDINANHTATVTKKNFHGSYFTYELMLSDGISVLCSTPAHTEHKYAEGDLFPLKLCIEHLVLFNR